MTVVAALTNLITLNKSLVSILPISPVPTEHDMVIHVTNSIHFLIACANPPVSIGIAHSLPKLRGFLYTSLEGEIGVWLESPPFLLFSILRVPLSTLTSFSNII